MASYTFCKLGLLLREGCDAHKKKKVEIYGLRAEESVAYISGDVVLRLEGQKNY
jgi:hypothetical protein